jgi:hypothetical protein
MPIPPHYDSLVYPSNIDFFWQVNNGNAPDNIVDARLVNKIQNALMAMESHVRYSTDTPTSTGNYLLLESRATQLQSDLADPGLLYSFTFPVNSTIASQQFAGNPFNRSNAILVNGVGYKIVNGARSYYSCRSAVNVHQENGNYTLTVNVIKDAKWRAGDYVEVNLMVARSAPSGTSQAAVSFPDVTGELWLFQADALTGLNDGDLISSWPDGSGNGFTLTQSTSGRRWTYKTGVQNGLPVARGATSGHFMAVSGLTRIRTSYSFYWTVNYTPGQTGDAPLIAAQSANGGFDQEADAGAGGVGYFWSGTTYAPGTPGVSGWQVLTYVFDSATSSGFVYRNNTLILSGGFNLDGPQTDSAWLIGSYGAGSDAFVGDYGEMRCYGSAHDTTNRTTVVSYLRNKWGI